MGLHDHARYHVKSFGLVYTFPYISQLKKIYPKTGLLKSPRANNYAAKGLSLRPHLHVLSFY